MSECVSVDRRMALDSVSLNGDVVRMIIYKYADVLKPNNCQAFAC